MYERVKKPKENKSIQLARKRKRDRQKGRDEKELRLASGDKLVEVTIDNKKQNESKTKYNVRKALTIKSINKLRKNLNHSHYTWANAALISCNVYSSLDGLIGTYTPESLGIIELGARGEDRLNINQAPKDKAYEYGLVRANKDSEKKVRANHGKNDLNLTSSDGEIRLLETLNKDLREYLTKLGIKKSRISIRIELLGPRATCEDCQEALKRWKDNIKNDYPDTDISIVARWIEGRGKDENTRTNASGQKNKNQSTTYGSDQAYLKDKVRTTNNKKKRKEEQAIHYKMHI
ncbi:hypothetical protein [Zooshikella sp. RANM57]|uniref:hypothetical protein n=1 Tax=Zooshikella sp. RANM57 TaxID=3425863 RepID=UPI003D701C2C